MEISIAAEKLFSIGSFPVTNAFLIGFLVSVFLILLMQVVVRKMVLVPRGAQNVLETVFEGLLSLIESVLGNKAQSRRAFPLIATIFLFVLVKRQQSLKNGFENILS